MKKALQIVIHVLAIAMLMAGGIVADASQFVDHMDNYSEAQKHR